MLSRVCESCGSKFETKGWKARWCPGCRAAGRRADSAAHGRQRRRELRRIVECICHRCGETFRAKRSDAMFCVECQPIEAKLKAQRFEQRNRSTCDSCGAETSRRHKRCRTCGQLARNMRLERNPAWKGGRSADRQGYVLLRTSRPGQYPYEREHRLVWEQRNGPMPKGWVVHHLNGVKDDNRIENLAAMPRHEHHKYPREALVPYEQRIWALEEQLRTRD